VPAGVRVGWGGVGGAYVGAQRIFDGGIMICVIFFTHNVETLLQISERIFNRHSLHSYYLIHIMYSFYKKACVKLKTLKHHSL
jgi:hypothetical protein